MTSDRFITNRNLDGDIVITVNDGGVSTEVMRIDGATGRVGIGTTSPVSSLDVRGDAYVSGKILVANGSVGSPSIVFSSDDDGTGTGIYRVGANSLGFAANGASAASYDGNGAWTFANTVSVGTDLILTGSGIRNIRTDSADGSDNRFMYISSASAVSASRGAYIGLAGNEYPSLGGQLEFGAGNASTAAGSNIALYFTGVATAGGSAVTIGSATGAGAWTFGPSSGTGIIHTLNRWTKVQVTGGTYSSPTTVNSLAPTSSWWQFEGAGTVTLNGIIPPLTGANLASSYGVMLFLIARDATVTINHLSGSAGDSTQRIRTRSGSAITLQPGQAAQLTYIEGTNNWYVISPTS